jgi:protein ImuA
VLDAQLPGGGWPVGALTEVLQPEPSRHAWQLLQPALAQATAARPGGVVLVAPPYEPFAPALQAAGLPPQRLCQVRPAAVQTGSAATAALWATEQALRCRDVLAVVAWLPQALPEQLRRLQLAAAQMGQLLWVLRPAHARQQASPAPLRLWVQEAVHSPMAMQVQVLKRRGPPLEQPLVLPGCSARLAQVLAAAAARSQQRRGQGAVAAAWGAGVDAGAAPSAALGPIPAVAHGAVQAQSAQATATRQSAVHGGAVPGLGHKEGVHALDRMAVSAAA